MSDDIRIAPATPADHDAVLRLLQHEHLPIDGLAQHWGETLVARRQARIVASAALEVYPDGALLRSVAVSHDERGRGLGVRMAEAALERSRQLGLPAVFLLTTTAERFFPRLGFEVIERSDVPASVQQSVEFTSACPASATVMRVRLSPQA